MLRYLYQKLATAQVAKAYTNHATKYAQLSTDSDTVLKVTGQHLFYQKTSDTWIKAHQLKVGMKLYLPHTDSFELITHKQVIEENTATYNFEVPLYHNYLVGKNGILAHNANPSKAFTSTDKFRVLFYKLNLLQFKDAEQSARDIGQTTQRIMVRGAQHENEGIKALESGDPKLIKKWGFKAEMDISRLSNYAEMTPFEAAVWDQYHINNNGGKPTRLNKETQYLKKHLIG